METSENVEIFCELKYNFFFLIIKKYKKKKTKLLWDI